MISSSIQPGTRTPNIIRSGLLELMVRVTIGRDLVTTLTFTRQAVLGAVVRVLVRDGGGVDVVGVEGALGCAAGAFAGLLAALVRGAVGVGPRRGHARGVGDPGEGGCGGDEESEGDERGFHCEGVCEYDTAVVRDGL